MVKAVSPVAGDQPTKDARRFLARLVWAGGIARPADLRAAADAVAPDFLSRAAVLAAGRGHDRIAIPLLAVLSRRDPIRFARAFGRVVTTGDRLRAFVRCMRSGQAGRRSLGTRPKAMVRDWLDRATEAELLAASVGNDPSLADLLRLVHPKPASTERAALYRWLLGDRSADLPLPPLVAALQTFRTAPVGEPPDVPPDLLTHLDLTPAQWASLARRMPLDALLRRLNFLRRKGAFDDPATLSLVAARLRDPVALDVSGVGPFRLLSLLRALDPAAPQDLHAALAAALERAAERVAAVTGPVVLCLDVSGAMARRATDRPRGAATAVDCNDVSALMLAALARGNRSVRLLPYADTVATFTLTPEDTIPRLSKQLAAAPGRASRIRLPLDHLKAQKKPVGLVVIVTANAAWGHWAGQDDPQADLDAWQRIRAHNPKARLVCLQIRPDIRRHGPIALPRGRDVLHLSGFSDDVFDRIAEFVEDRSGEDYWIGQIEATAD